MRQIISKTRSAHAQAHYFLLDRLQDITTNRINFEHAFFIFIIYYIASNVITINFSLLHLTDARLMTNFSTSLSQRLSLAQYSASTFFTYSQTDRNRSAVMVLNPSSAVFRRITHLSKSSTIMTIGCTFRVAGGYILSGTGIRDAVVEARSSGGVVTDWEL